METAPAVVFTYNRLDKTRTVLDALGRNSLAKNTDLYIFNDAANPAKPQDQEKVKAIREYLTEYQKNSPFRSIQLHLAPEHQGLAKSVIAGADLVLEKYGSIIVTEDDLVSHENYLEYMNNALNYYKDDERVWSISGYTWPLETMKNRSEVYFTYRGSSWGWGTWKDRWDTVDWTMKDYDGIFFHKERRHNLAMAGRDLFKTLHDQKHGIVDSWAVRWCFEESRHQKVTVYPAQTFLHNIGMDGSGSHGVTDGNDSWTDLKPIDYQLIPYRLEKEVLNEFARNYADPYFHTVQKF